jgi:hypothetical protein
MNPIPGMSDISGSAALLLSQDDLGCAGVADADCPLLDGKARLFYSKQEPEILTRVPTHHDDEAPAADTGSIYVSSCAIHASSCTIHASAAIDTHTFTGAAVKVASNDGYEAIGRHSGDFSRFSQEGNTTEHGRNIRLLRVQCERHMQLCMQPCLL